MEKEQKERLEQELRFLKESLEAEVISRDEYEKGKERIERKLKEIEEKPPGEIEKEPIISEEKQPEEVKEETKEEIEIKEIKEQPTKIIGAEEEKPETEEKEEPKEEPEKEEEKKPEEEPEEEIKISKKWLYGIAIILIAIILFFSIRGCGKSEEETPVGIDEIEEFIPECSSDSDCKQKGMVGICSNPATKQAKCEFKEDVKTTLTVINDKDCKLCDSSRMKTIVKTIFPNADIKEIDYKTEEAEELIDNLNINALPAYAFDSNVKDTINFNDFKSALIKKGDNYVITNTASGANYYFKRPLIENQLDLYVLPETNGKTEASVQEVLDLFKDKINFTKHIVTKTQKGILERELAINTYPAFLINNQYKFRGVLPANIIKEKICQVNTFKECTKELSKI